MISPLLDTCDLVSRLSCLPSNELKYGPHVGCQSAAFVALSVVSVWTVAYLVFRFSGKIGNVVPSFLFINSSAGLYPETDSGVD